MLAAAFALTLFAQDPAPPPPAPAPAVTVRRAGDPANSIGVGEVGYLSPPGETSLGQILLVEAPGYRTPVHVHHHTDETFYVLSGRLSLWVDGQVHELEAGDYVHIPRGVPHAQGNRGEAATHLLMTVAPGDFVGFFRAREVIIQTTPPGHPDYGPRIRALGAEFDIENVGEPPF